MITVTLTPVEIAARSQSLADYAIKLAELADEEDRVKAEYKSTMADIKEERLDIGNQLRRLSRAVRLGVEERTTQAVLFEEEKRQEEFRQQQASQEAVTQFFGDEGFNPGFPPGFDSDRAEQGLAQADDFAAPICDECKRIDGGHSAECSQSNALTFDDYLAYAQANYKRNHQSHARKMHLRAEPDLAIKVRKWIEDQPEVKKKGAHLSPVSAAVVKETL